MIYLFITVIAVLLAVFLLFCTFGGCSEAIIPLIVCIAIAIFAGIKCEESGLFSTTAYVEQQEQM